MTPENIAYTARVNAAYWLIRKARKIAMRPADTTSEQRQAIEDEIVQIGMRLYGAATQEAEPETTHDPGEDPELAAYIAAVRKLDPCVEWWFAQNDYKHGFTAEKSAERWREFGVYLRGSKGDE